MPRLSSFCSLLAVFLTCLPPARAAGTKVDPKFQPEVLTNGRAAAVLVQPDGKWLVGGNFTSVDGVPRTGAARFNVDGSLDRSFVPVFASEGHPAGYNVDVLALQPDGKILAAGRFPASFYAPFNRIYRLNPDGSADPTFQSGGGVGPNSWGGGIRALAVQDDGKILVGGGFNSFDGTRCGNVIRLNADGTLDHAFYSPYPDHNNGESVEALVLQPDGRILVAGDLDSYQTLSHPGPARLNADGTPDPSYDPSALADGKAEAILRQPDGKLLVAGAFHTPDQTYHTGFYRLDADGSPDPTFQPQTSSGLYGPTGKLALQADGKLVVGGFFTEVGGVSRQHLARLNADGTLDAAYQPDTTGDVYDLALRRDGSVVAVGSFPLPEQTGTAGFLGVRSDGTVETASGNALRAPGGITTAAVQRDGKLLVGGSLTQINGLPHTGVTRLNHDGSTDTAFVCDVAANEYVEGLTLQPDGKILLEGRFNVVDDESSDPVARLNTNGSRDAGFHAPRSLGGDIRRVLPQPDGKLVIAGSFYKGKDGLGKAKRSGVYRFLADGSPDPTFQPARDLGRNIDDAVLGQNGAVVVLGKLRVGGTSHPAVVRLRADGSLDPTFAPAILGDDDYGYLAAQSDGKIIVAGTLTSINGTPCHGVIRLGPNGTLDAGYDPDTDNTVQDNVGRVQMLPGDRLFIEGLFLQVGGTSRYHAAVFNPDGSLDPNFDPDAGNGGEIIVVAQQGRKLYVLGDFRSLDGQPRASAARLKLPK